MSSARAQDLIARLGQVTRDDLAATRVELERARRIMAEAVGSLTASFCKLVDDTDAERAVVHALLATVDRAAGAGAGDTAGAVPEDAARHGIGIDRFIDETSAALQAVTTALREVARDVEAGVRSTDPVLEQVDVVLGVVLKLEAITQKSRILALNARIEAARAGSGGAAFAVVASAMRDLASYCAELNEKIADQVNHTRAILSDARGAFGRATVNGLAGATAAERRSTDLVQQLEGMRSSLERELARLSEIARRVKENVGVAVGGLQFSELVDQLLRSVDQRIGRIERSIAVGVGALGGGDPEPALAGLLSELEEGDGVGGAGSPADEAALAPGAVELF